MSRTRKQGLSAVEFEVDVLHASGERLELVADGPVALGVEYVLRPAGDGSEVEASISVEGRGLFGRVSPTQPRRC